MSNFGIDWTDYENYAYHYFGRPRLRLQTGYKYVFLDADATLIFGTGGVMGAYIVLYPRAPVHMLVFFGFFFTRIIVPAFVMLGYWFLLQFFGGFFFLGSTSGGAAFWAHIGGFIGGIILIKLFCSSSKASECRLKRGRADRIIQRYTPL